MGIFGSFDARKAIPGAVALRFLKSMKSGFNRAITVRLNTILKRQYPLESIQAAHFEFTYDTEPYNLPGMNHGENQRSFVFNIGYKFNHDFEKVPGSLYSMKKAVSVIFERTIGHNDNYWYPIGIEINKPGNLPKESVINIIFRSILEGVVLGEMASQCDHHHFTKNAQKIVKKYSKTNAFVHYGHIDYSLTHKLRESIFHYIFHDHPGDHRSHSVFAADHHDEENKAA